jgi:ribosome-associated protein
MRVKVADLTELPDRVRNRLRELAGSRLTNGDEIIIDAQRFRTQERNKQDAIERLLAMLRKAAERKKFRVKTRPSLSAKRKRVDTKKKRGDIKKLRKRPID